MRYTRYRQYPVEQRGADEAGVSLHGGIDGTAEILAEKLDRDIHDLIGHLHDHDTRLTEISDRVATWTDTGMVEITGITAGPNWTITQRQRRSWGPVTQIFVEVQRTGTALSANASGNIVGDPVLFTLPAALIPHMRTYGGYAASVTSGAFYLQTSGACTVLDANSNSSITVGDYLRVSHTYFTAA